MLEKGSRPPPVRQSYQLEASRPNLLVGLSVCLQNKKGFLLRHRKTSLDLYPNFWSSSPLSVQWNLKILENASKNENDHKRASEWRHPLQITTCWIMVTWPYAAGFLLLKYQWQLLVGTAVLTCSTLNYPHFNCFQWFPRLGVPRGMHPLKRSFSLISQTELRSNWMCLWCLVDTKLFQLSYSFWT